jgi:hypothetical protein
MRRIFLILLAVILAVGLLGYAAHSLDIVGLIASAHQPPPH